MITNIELARSLNDDRDRWLAVRHRLAGVDAAESNFVRRALGRRLEQLGKRLQGHEVRRPSRSNA